MMPAALSVLSGPGEQAHSFSLPQPARANSPSKPLSALLDLDRGKQFYVPFEGVAELSAVVHVAQSR